MNKALTAVTLILLVVITLSPSIRPLDAANLSYRQDRVPQQWIEAGTPLGLREDDLAINYTLPFSFDFYGTNYTFIWISTNGLISFTAADTSYTNSDLELARRKAIAPLWDDLQTNPGNRNDTDVFAGLLDPDQFLIRWKAVPLSQWTVEVNFEAILARNGTIMFNYGPSNGSVDATVGISKGTSLAGDYYANTVTSSNNIQSFLYTPISGSRPVLIYNTSPGQPWLLGETITFNASASYDPDGTIVSYLWSFGDNATGTTAIATHTYTATGQYTVTISITDDAGFIVSTSFQGKVENAEARLVDAWPETRTLDLFAQENLTVNGRALSLSSIKLYVRINFQLTNLKTGTTIQVTSQTVQLNTREETLLSAIFIPQATTARYMVYALFEYTPRSPTSSQPGWISNTYFFRFRVIA